MAKGEALGANEITQRPKETVKHIHETKCMPYEIYANAEMPANSKEVLEFQRIYDKHIFICP